MQCHKDVTQCRAFGSLSGYLEAEQGLSVQKWPQVMLDGKVKPCQEKVLCATLRSLDFILCTADH